MNPILSIFGKNNPIWYSSTYLKSRSDRTPLRDTEEPNMGLFTIHTFALNNKERAFSKADLDDICLQLSPESSAWWNPHRSPIGLGNYDVNVMMAALQIKDCQAIWFDKRK